MCRALNFLILVFSFRIFVRLKYICGAEPIIGLCIEYGTGLTPPGYGPTLDNGDKRHIGNIDNRLIH